MLIKTMSKMMETLAPSSVHVLEPGRPRNAEGLADKVYEQMRRDFMVASPFVLHAEVPELLAGAWALVRETLFTGNANRAQKEVIAWAVSSANQCPFCIDAHHAAVRAAKIENRSLEKWAKATATADSPALAVPPFDNHVAEYLGTVVAFHYLNRMVSIFLDEKMMPVPGFMDTAMAPMATLMMGGMMRKGESNKPGDSLALLPDTDPALAWTPAWAKESTTVASALASWSSIIETCAKERLDAELLRVVGQAIKQWRGEPVDDNMQIVSDLAVELHSCAELALLTAMAPYKIGKQRLQDVVDSGNDSESILVLVAWAAQRAARQSAQWTAAAGGLERENQRDLRSALTV